MLDKILFLLYNAVYVVKQVYFTGIGSGGVVDNGAYFKSNIVV